MATPARELDALAERVAQITQLATEVFEDPTYAVAWLNEPNLATDNQRPIKLLNTQEGFLVLKNLLLRIEYGILA